MTDDKDQVRWLIEWTYSPADFFEEPLQIRRAHCELSINDGKIVAKVDPAYGDPCPTLRDQLDAELNYRFMAAQLESPKPFQLSQSPICIQEASGVKHASVVLGDSMGLSDSRDVQLTGKDGTVIGDTRATRIKRTRSLADLAAKYAPTDAVVCKILQSHKNAINDRDDLFVHLYEIRDALKARFGGEEEAKKALNIPNGKWKDLGKLSNVEPLNQGRHRGEKPGLRDATKEEIDRGMAAAQMMIENYLRYVDGTL